MNTQPEQKQPRELGDNVVPLHDHFATIDDALDPGALSEAETYEYILSQWTDTDIVTNASVLAGSINDLLGGKKMDDAWSGRIQALLVDASSLDDDLYEQVAKDSVVRDALSLIRSKNGHLQGNEDILRAVRKLIDLRAGVVLQHNNLLKYDHDRWKSIVANLAKTSLQ